MGRALQWPLLALMVSTSDGQSEGGRAASACA
jgi:hypothetical protein